MLLIDERLDVILSRSDEAWDSTSLSWNLHRILNTEIAFLRLVTLATCHNKALSTSKK